MSSPEATRYTARDVLPLLVVAVLGVVYAVLSRYAFDAFPYSGDEYSVYLQAEAFARGLLHTDAPAKAVLFRVDHVIIDEWVRSKYPPGAALVLSLGVRAGVPWLVAPLEGVLTLVLAWWTARRELGAKCAWITLLVLGLAPLFAFHASTFYSHPTSTMLLALGFSAVSCWTHDKRDGWLVILGLSLGFVFITRPLDAVLFGAGLLVLKSPRLVVFSIAGVVPFFAGNLWYQNRQFGSPFVDGYHVYEPTFAAIYGAVAAVHPISLLNLVSPLQQFHHIDIVRAFTVDWTVAGSVIVAIVGAFAVGPAHPARAMRNVSIAISLVILVTMLPMVSDPDDGARPRYLSTVLLTVSFLAGPGWTATRDMLSARIGLGLTRAIAVAALVFAPAQIASFLMFRLPLHWEREGLYKAIEKDGVHDGIVVVRARFPTRYARNGPFFDRPVLYLAVPYDMPVDAVAAEFPGRDVYEAYEAFDGAEWVVRKRVGVGATGG